MSDLVQVTHGVWRRADSLDDLGARVAALLAGLPDGTVVSGLTAALLHGLWLPPRVDGGRIEVIVHPETPIPSSRSGSRRAQIRARRKMLADDEVVTLDGIPITTEARTWFDLAQSLSPVDLVAAGDSCLRGTACLADLEEMCRRAGHRPGVVRCRAVLPLLDARSRSRPESHMRFRLGEAGLPTPEVNTPIHTVYGEWVAEPDLHYDDVRLAIEYNGAHHGSTDRMRRDITRGVDVDRAGWRTLTVGPREVFDRPDQFVSLVRHLRHLRTARPAPRSVAQ